MESVKQKYMDSEAEGKHFLFGRCIITFLKLVVDSFLDWKQKELWFKLDKTNAAYDDSGKVERH